MHVTWRFSAIPQNPWLRERREDEVCAESKRLSQSAQTVLIFSSLAPPPKLACHLRLSSLAGVQLSPLNADCKSPESRAPPLR